MHSLWLRLLKALAVKQQETYSSLFLPPPTLSQSECTSGLAPFQQQTFTATPYSPSVSSIHFAPLREGQRTWEGDVVLPSNSPESDFQTISPNQTMQLNYHIISQHLNLLSPRLRQFHRRKTPSLNLLVPLQLHLKALLQDLSPSTVVIEMIAMLFVDTVMGKRGRDTFSNPDKGEQSFPKSNYEQNGTTAKVCSMTIRENWGISVPLLYCKFSTRRGEARRGEIQPLDFHYGDCVRSHHSKYHPA